MSRGPDDPRASWDETQQGEHAGWYAAACGLPMNPDALTGEGEAGQDYAAGYRRGYRWATQDRADRQRWAS